MFWSDRGLFERLLVLIEDAHSVGGHAASCWLSSHRVYSLHSWMQLSHHAPSGPDGPPQRPQNGLTTLKSAPECSYGCLNSFAWGLCTLAATLGMGLIVSSSSWLR